MNKRGIQMIIMIIVFAFFTFVVLFGSYYSSTNNDSKAGILFMGIIIPLSFLFAFWIQFSKFPIPSFGFIDKFLMDKFWLFFLSALSVGSIPFLIIVAFEKIALAQSNIKRNKIMLTETDEERQLREEKETTKREQAQEKTQRGKELVENNRVVEAQIKEAKQKNVQELKCPKCGSTNLTANTKGFGLGKAAVGGVLLGPVGLLGGLVGSKKAVFICLKCGNQFQK